MPGLFERRRMRRIKEPSTWAGVAALLEVAKLMFPAWEAVFVALQGAAGAVAVAVREGGA